jgi:hypothetical protein
MPFRRSFQLGCGHDPSVVDQDVQRVVPPRRTGCDRVQVGQANRTVLNSQLAVVVGMSAATREPAPVLRTARVAFTPDPASARAVPMPMVEAPPVTAARLPERSIPAATSAAVHEKPKGAAMGFLVQVILRTAPQPPPSSSRGMTCPWGRIVETVEHVATGRSKRGMCRQPLAVGFGFPFCWVAMMTGASEMGGVRCWR